MKESGITIMLRERIELQGQSISKVPKDIGMIRNTIRKYLRDGEQKHGLKGRKRPSKLEPFKEIIDKLMASGIYNAQVIYERLAERGYTGKVTIIKDYLRPRRPVTVTKGFAVQRYESKPGSQVQMDWGICDYIDSAGQRCKTSCFAMVLGFSRVRYPNVHMHINSSLMPSNIKEKLELTSSQQFVKTVEEYVVSQQTQDIKSQKKQLAECQRRMQEFEKLLCRIYEDNAFGKLLKIIESMPPILCAGGSRLPCFAIDNKISRKSGSQPGIVVLPVRMVAPVSGITWSLGSEYSIETLQNTGQNTFNRNTIC